MTTTTEAKARDLRLWATPDSVPATSLTPSDIFGGGAVFAVEMGVQAGVFPVVPTELGYAAEAVTKIEAARDTIAASVMSESDFVAHHTARILDGQDFDDDYPEVVRNFVAAQQLRATAITLTEQMRRRVQMLQPQVVAAAVPAMLDGLRSDLEELLHRAAEIASILGGLDVTDPQAAAAGTDEQRSTFAELPALVARYHQIRGAQKVLSVATNKPPPGNDANTHTWTWFEFYERQAIWEFSDGAARGAGADKGAQAQRLLMIAVLDVVWLPTYDELRAKYDAWWNADDPEPLPARALPDLQPGQHHYLGTRG